MVVAALVVAVLLSDTTAALCEGTPESAPCGPASDRDSTEEVLQRSSHVFAGRATSISAVPDGRRVVAAVTFRVSTWFKGGKGATVTILDPCAGCVAIDAGTEYLVYAYSTPDGPMINRNTRTRKLADVPALEIARLLPDRAATLTDAERDILEEVLGPASDKIVVRDRTIPFRFFSDPGPQLRDVDRALYDRLLMRNENEYASLTALKTRRVESGEAIDAAFDAGFWDEFHRRFGSGTALLSVSLPVIKGDVALVYRAMSCGELCGQGEIILLRFTRSGWKIFNRYSIWVS